MAVAFMGATIGQLLDIFMAAGAASPNDGGVWRPGEL
jgi:hypothetical protein